MVRLLAIIVLGALAGCGAGHIACDIVKWMGRRGWWSVWGPVAMVAMLALTIGCMMLVI